MHENHGTQFSTEDLQDEQIGGSAVISLVRWISQIQPDRKVRGIVVNEHTTFHGRRDVHFRELDIVSDLRDEDTAGHFERNFLGSGNS
jgi:hypothetical protein